MTGIAIPNINVPGGPQSAASASGSDALAQQTAEKIINTLQYIPTGNYLDAADNAILPYINKALTSQFQSCYFIVFLTVILNASGVFLGDQHAEKYVSESEP